MAPSFFQKQITLIVEYAAGIAREELLRLLKQVILLLRCCCIPTSHITKLHEKLFNHFFLFSWKDLLLILFLSITTTCSKSGHWDFVAVLTDTTHTTFRAVKLAEILFFTENANEVCCNQITCAYLQLVDGIWKLKWTWGWHLFAVQVLSNNILIGRTIYVFVCFIKLICALVCKCR